MSGPIHVVHVAGSAQWAGGERFLLQMIEGLNRRDFKLSLVLPEKGPLEAEIARRGIPHKVLPLSPAGSPLPAFALSRLLKEWKPDMVQGHGVRSNVYARLAAGKIPCISTIHDPIANGRLPSPGVFLRRTADALTARRSVAVVCSSERLRADFLKRCPGLWEKTFVIPHGVDMDKFNPVRQNREAVRRELGLGDRWTLALVGRLTDRKGHDLLLEALSRVKATLPPFWVLFAGDGPLRPALEEKARRLNLGEEVLFLGVRTDIPNVLAAADLVISPMVSQGFPYVLIEAMATEKPAIAFQVEGVGEIMPTGEEGYLVPPGSPEKLLEAILTVLWNKEDAATRAQTGRRLAQREYDLKKTITRWESLYRQLSGDLLIK